MGVPRRAGRGGARTHAEHRLWLSDKRAEQEQSKVESREDEAEPREGIESPAQGGNWAEQDFRGFYEAQHLLGAADYEAMWKTMRTPLPVTLSVDLTKPHAPLLEARLSKDGWQRRTELDGAGLSVWEIEGKQYSSSPSKKAWAEQENRRGNLNFQELVSMLPALLLRPLPEHSCLDLCAAPGSKSVQLLRLLRTPAAASVTLAEETAAASSSAKQHAKQHAGVAAAPRGVVLSVELDAHRACVILPRNLAKAGNPCSAAVLANAQHFPSLLEADGRAVPIQRILVDVPCSGDGTTRKNFQVWRSWRRGESLDLFSKQRNILSRALYLLAPGGVLVYSTCSLNPVENEAVVGAALAKWHQDVRHDAIVELVDAATAMREAGCSLVADPGVTTWKVPSGTRFGPIFGQWQEVPEDLRIKENGKKPDTKWPLRPDMFPDQASAQLARCARFYPQRSNTGGFFVAVFKKGVPEVMRDPSVAAQQAKQQPSRLGRSHPLARATWRAVKADDAAWIVLRDFFGLEPQWFEDKLRDQLLFWQCLHGDEPSRLALLSPGASRLALAQPGDRRPLPWIRLGVFLFEMLPKGFLTGMAATRWQVAAEGADIIGPAISQRVIHLNLEGCCAALAADHRQVSLAQLPANLLHQSPGLLEDGPASEATTAHGGERRHICGGVLLKCDHPSLGQVVLPGVLTPQLLRLLIENQEAAGLSEEVGLVAPLHKEAGDEDADADAENVVHD